MSTDWLPFGYLGNTVLNMCSLVRTVVDLICRSSETIYNIVFYAGVCPALEVQKSVIFLHFTKFLTIHRITLTVYMYQWCSNMTIVRVIVKSIVA